MKKDEKNDLIERIKTDIKSVSLTEYKSLIVEISQEIIDLLSEYPLSNSDIISILNNVSSYINKGDIFSYINKRE